MISLAVVAIGFVVLGALFTALERALPSRRGAPPSKALGARRLDYAYWLLTPLVTGLLTRMGGLGVAVLLVAAAGLGADAMAHPLEAWHARSPLGALPLAAQVALALVLVDLASYASHRLRHARRLFPLHAVHHSPRELDWLAAARMHPLDDLLDNVLVLAPVLALGLDPIVFLLVGPLLLLHTIYLHAALDWDLGPLRFVIASPAFHRVHHSADPAALDRNYGGVLAIWDVMFGTFLDPRAHVPERFGLPDAHALPESLGAQLRVPIARVRDELSR